MRRAACLWTIALGIVCAARAGAEIKIIPEEITLYGPRGQQHLRVVQVEKGQVIGDVTAEAQLTSSQPGVARLAEGPVVQAVGDGACVLTAAWRQDKAQARVRVQGVQQSFTWSFRRHVLPVLTRLGCNSGACHGAQAGKGGLKLSLRGYAPQNDYFVLTRQAGGRRINRLEPALSLLLRKPTLTVPHGGGRRLAVGSLEYQVLAEWIADGCPGPRPDDPILQRLEVLPAEAILKPGQTLQVLVRAWYSDGQSLDVTRWAKFNSTEEGVAAVNDQGEVRGAGYGEAAISVWYANHVALCQVHSPFPQAVDPKLFAEAPRNNYIDDLVLKKLAALHLPPSPLCSDQEFIRRVYLDTAGILPTPEEVQHFLSDPRPDKRVRLADALLERPEFVDYWTYKWCDLFLVSSRKLPLPAVWAFYQYLRQSVADNKPWDQLAREILTAQGSNLENGAVNYFVRHRDIAELTETTAVTFLGMSVTCCRCHNHPLEKWTQDQYWSLANLFARVGRRNGDRPGEVILQSLPDGDVLHLRRGIPMPPAPLDGAPLSLDSPRDRRQYFADWLTAPNNPWFAPALVNRVWRNFLGRGLVEPEDDFRQTNPPTNGELLDALAKDFIAHKYDVKYLIKTILTSATYQRSSLPLPGNAADDRFYSHYLVRRLPAEVILDTYAQVTGVPTRFDRLLVGTSGGVTTTDAFPLGTRALQLPDTLVVSRFLDSFGRPERSQACSCERMADASVTQALHLNNGQTLNERLRDKNCRLTHWLAEGIRDEEALERLFLLALCRPPTAAERQRLLTLMREGQQTGSSRREVLEDLFWAVLTSREFLFNH